MVVVSLIHQAPPQLFAGEEPGNETSRSYVGHPIPHWSQLQCYKQLKLSPVHYSGQKYWFCA